jgi:tol-pal system protein YbgF
VNAVTKSQADVNQTKENLVLSLQFIKEEINDLKNSLSKINDQLLATPPPATDTFPSQDGENNAPAQNSMIQSPDSIYYTAYSDYLKKNYQLAIDGFKQFIQHYPNHGLADNAYYWIGECYYTQKMYQDAINTFSEIIDNHQSGDKIPDATLKKGFTLIEMGKQAQGIDVLKGLISKFPLTDEAKLAQQKINEVVE